MLCKDVHWCSIENWYPEFNKLTFKTIILPIPNEVLNYLKSDNSLILPKECCEDQDLEVDEPLPSSGGEDEDENQEQARVSHVQFTQL